MAEVPCDTRVYLQPPVLGVPSSQSPRGRQPSKVRVLSEEPAVRVEALRHAPETDWQRPCVRAIERGEWRDRFAARRVWTVAGDHAVEEWLVIRQESDGRYSYAMSNKISGMSLRSWLKSVMAESLGNPSSGFVRLPRIRIFGYSAILNGGLYHALIKWFWPER